MSTDITAASVSKRSNDVHVEESTHLIVLQLGGIVPAAS